MQFESWMESVFFGYRASQWLTLFLIIFTSVLLRNFSKYFLSFIRVLVSRTKNKWDDEILEAIEKPFVWIFLGLVCFFSVHALGFEGMVLKTVTTIAQVLLSFGLVWSLYRLTSVVVEFLLGWASKTDTEIDDHLIPLLSKSLKIFVLTAGILVSLQNIGVNVYSLVAGLGVGGLAIALAAKDTAANFFGSIMIFLDRPFRVGDWVKFGEYEGTVEAIGFRSTRMRTFYDSQIYVPNSIVANSHVDNMGRRRFRRAVAKLGVTYDTPPQKLEAFLEGIKNIIVANPFTRKDFFHVVFNEYGNFNLEIMVYFFLKVPGWSEELVQRQNVYVEIYRLAEELGVEFAFPTQTLHIDRGMPKEKKLESIEELKRKAEDFSEKGKLSKPQGFGIFRPRYKEVDKEF
ncbi:MAG: mechanosensitive ion channel family protein [Bdellovibrionota bacterium]